MGVGFTARVCYNLPTLINVGIFSVVQYVVVTQLVSGFLGGNWSMCSCIFGVSVRGRNIRSFISQNPGDFYSFKFLKFLIFIIVKYT